MLFTVLIPCALRLNATVSAGSNSSLDSSLVNWSGSDAYAALAWRELFLNSCRGTPNDFLLNYAAALTF